MVYTGVTSFKQGGKTVMVTAGDLGVDTKDLTMAKRKELREKVQSDLKAANDGDDSSDYYKRFFDRKTANPQERTNTWTLVDTATRRGIREIDDTSKNRKLFSRLNPRFKPVATTDYLYGVNSGRFTVSD